MKKFIKIFLIGSALLLATITNAQDQKSFTIVNVSSEVVWPAVFDAFKELKLPSPLIATQQGTGETSYYNYKSLMIKNRLRFKLNYQDDKLTISIFGRQYYTKSGWGDNPLPMSKKQVAKILNPIKERVTELTKNKTIASTNNKTQTNQEAKTIKKAGIYEDLVIVKTDDEEMDLLAVHKNGAMIGYDLWDDNKTIKSMVFKEKEDSEAITLLFDEQGFPKGMVTDQIIVNISSIGGNMAELTVLDLQGNTIGNNKIELPITEQTIIEIQEDKNTHGPSDNHSFMFIDEDLLSFSLNTSSTLFKATSCGAAVAGGVALGASTAGIGGAIVFTGVVAACESIYFDLVARYVGEDHFLFKELNLASDISSIISAIIIPSDTKKWINILSLSNDAITSLKNSIEGGIRLFNKYGLVSKTQIAESNQEIENTDSIEKNKTKEEFIRISALDPALGVATTNIIPATEKYSDESSHNTITEAIDYTLDEKNIGTVERNILDKILGELNIGSSELADPNQKLKQGRIILAGFYIITKYTSNKEKTTFNLRVIYTETGEIIYANTLNFNGPKTFNVEDEAEKEAPKIIAALEKFANERVLIIKENPKRYKKR